VLSSFVIINYFLYFFVYFFSFWCLCGRMSLIVFLSYFLPSLRMHAKWWNLLWWKLCLICMTICIFLFVWYVCSVFAFAFAFAVPVRPFTLCCFFFCGLPIQRSVWQIFWSLLFVLNEKPDVMWCDVVFSIEIDETTAIFKVECSESFDLDRRLLLMSCEPLEQ